MNSELTTNKKQNLQINNEDQHFDLMKLPIELLIHIFSFLESNDLLSLTLTSRKLYDIITSTKRLYGKWTLWFDWKRPGMDHNSAARALIRSDRIFQNLDVAEVDSLKDLKYLLLLIGGFKDKVESIELFECEIKEADFAFLMNELSGLKKITLFSIKYILDKRAVITPPSFNKLERIIMKGNSHYPSQNVEELEINNFFKLFSNATQINYAKIEDSGNLRFLCNMKNLKSLYIETNRFFTEEDLSEITFSLENFGLWFNVNNAPADNNLKKFLAKQPQLKKLIVDYHRYTNESLFDVVIAMKNLKILDLNLIEFEDTSALLQTNSSVEHLTFVNNSSCSIEFLNRLAKCFLAVKTLKLRAPKCGSFIQEEDKLTFNTGGKLESVEVDFGGISKTTSPLFEIKNLHAVTADFLDLEAFNVFAANHPDVRDFETRIVTKEQILNIHTYWKKLERLNMSLNYEWIDTDLTHILLCTELKQLVFKIVFNNDDLENRHNQILKIFGEKFEDHYGNSRSYYILLVRKKV